MRKLFLFVVIVVFITEKLHCQYQAANWPMQYNNLMLKISPDTFERDSLPHSTTGNCANTSVSDSQGNLLLYSFGVDVRNKYGNVLAGGCCLCEDSDIPEFCDTSGGGDSANARCLTASETGQRNPILPVH